MKLTFYGGAKNVSGANYLLEDDTGSTKILVDCGMNQGSEFCEEMNHEPFAYNPSSIDALFVTHAHIDHTGRIPKLCKEGFKGPIFSTGPTRDTAEFLLLDSEHLISEDARKSGKPALYSVEDVNNSLTIWQSVHYHEKIKIKDFEIEFFDAGHILGSSSVLITDKEGKKIVFSGDLGNTPAPLIKDTEYIKEADYALIESAYGNRIHENPGKRLDELEDAIEETYKDGGVLMIPAFAMERTQDLLYELNHLIENKKIPGLRTFMDSPLAIKLTQVYKKYSMNREFLDEQAVNQLKAGDAIFDFPGLEFTLTTEESKRINDTPPPKVIIAGSGMSQGGRILYHEMRYLPDPKSSILFVGYQAEGSRGRKILNGAKSVEIFGEEVQVRCKIRSISAYSAHADQSQLLQWLEPMRRTLKKVFVVQGDLDQMEPLAGKIRDTLAIDTIIPEPNEVVVL